jgi:hypothetical protein
MNTRIPLAAIGLVAACGAAMATESGHVISSTAG